MSKFNANFVVRDEGLQVLFHSVTAKGDDALIVMKWNKPIPERFIRKLLEDDDITDYLIFDASKVLSTQA